jgi:hypothetical protein
MSASDSGRTGIETISIAMCRADNAAAVGGSRRAATFSSVSPARRTLRLGQRLVHLRRIRVIKIANSPVNISADRRRRSLPNRLAIGRGTPAPKSGAASLNRSAPDEGWRWNAAILLAGTPWPSPKTRAGNQRVGHRDERLMSISSGLLCVFTFISLSWRERMITLGPGE